MRRISTLLCWALLAPAVFAQDPVKTDGDKYRVLMENDKVRVLEYRDKPGDKTSMHHHPDFVLYALSPFQRKLTLADGKTIMREFKTGEVMWSPAQSHIGENIGTTETHVVIVELKEKVQGSKEEKKTEAKSEGK